MSSTSAQCSRAGCRAAAEWNVNWRNPRIHPEDRVKVWLACDEHRQFLYDYLYSRGFPVTTQERPPHNIPGTTPAPPPQETP